MTVLALCCQNILKTICICDGACFVLLETSYRRSLSVTVLALCCQEHLLDESVTVLALCCQEHHIDSLYL